MLHAWRGAATFPRPICAQSLRPLPFFRLANLLPGLCHHAPPAQNDLLTLPTNMVDAHLMKLSISFALAQSTKLSVLEVRPDPRVAHLLIAHGAP